MNLPDAAVKYKIKDGLIPGVLESIRTQSDKIDFTGSTGAERAYLLSQLGRELKRPLFVVVPTIPAGEAFIQDLSFFNDKSSPPVSFFPPYNILPFKRIAYHNEIAARRIRILYQLALGGNEPSIVVAPVETLLQRIIPREVLCDYAELVMVNEDIDRDRFVEKLHAGGYAHASIVEEPGEYSIRGGIIDVFSPMYDDPVRIELFGDTVDSIRRFSAVNQRKTEVMDEAVILPAREAVLKKEWLDQIVDRARSQKTKAGLGQEAVAEFLERIRNEGVFAGIESLLPLIYPALDTVFDYLPGNIIYIETDPPAIEKEALKKEDLSARNYIAACEDNRMCVPPETIYQPWSSVKSLLSEKPRMNFRTVPVGSLSDADSSGNVFFPLSVEENSDLTARLEVRGKGEHLLQPLAEWIGANERNGYLTAIVCSTKYQTERLLGLLAPYGIRPDIVDFPWLSEHPGKAAICLGRLSAGFVWHDERIAVITDREIFGRKIRQRSRRENRQAVQAAFLDFGNLNTGDLIVHVTHGIGMYRGLEKITIEAITNDYLLIEYRDSDKLYLPVDRMDMVQKYMGVDGVVPVIDKLGGTSWEKVKSKAKKSVEKIAGELLKLYTERKVRKGHSFSEEDSTYKDFEAGFPYDETEDQMKAIEDVLVDMESPVPMDRLICGDVGYGKTEVALRAAFKAVTDGKQVAVLVPTTLLAEQHYRTFTERFSKYPVLIEGLSRFRNRKEQKEIIDRMKKGAADIVIGTHRLLQKDIEFKDLGLVIIDEEQRFGVRHKEKLKELRTTVDVLSMTATPIPRTLHMSLLGVRDISVISTPPEFRQPIISYISELDPAVISEAITNEMERGGQIFFIHNNIHSIWNMARHIKDLVPDVRLGVAHGRLEEAELEKVMYRFVNKEIDLLVTTTIVESGLDIPNANTIIINRADRFGLSQMYQLRGRVGRAQEQAYAYLIVPREAALTQDAQKRLKVLMEHSDLGAGFQIAMNDLKIRGGGAALGISQSGHIAAVGYDMFLKLMEDAVATFKGENVIEPLEPEINIPVSVYIPEAYIPDLDQRLSAYRRLAKMQEVREVADFREELTDRYGEPPQEILNLLLKIMLKILATRAGVKRLDLTWEALSMAFSEIHQKNPYGLVELIQSEPGRYRFTPEHTLIVPLGKSSINGLMSQSKKVLMEIAGCVN